MMEEKGNRKRGRRPATLTDLERKRWRKEQTAVYLKSGVPLGRDLTRWKQLKRTQG